MNRAEQEQQSSQNRAAPMCNAIALSAPFIGFACGLVAGVSAPHFQWFEWGFRVWLGFGVAGLLAGVIALVRAERLWGLTLAGLILNSVLVFLLALWFMPDAADRDPPPKTVPQLPTRPDEFDQPEVDQQ